MTFTITPRNKNITLLPGVAKMALPPNHILKPMLSTTATLATLASSSWPHTSAAEVLGKHNFEIPARPNEMKPTNIAQFAKIASTCDKADLPYEHFVLMEQYRLRSRIVHKVNLLIK
jgi:hypothetical protein